MKKVFLLTILAVLSITACQKSNLQDENPAGSENSSMTFTIGDELDVEVTSKAVTQTTTANLSTVTWMATSGTVGSDTQVYAPKSLTKSGTSFDTGYYWPSTNTSYNYYVANVATTAMSFSSSKAIITVPANTDVVAGKTTASWKSSPTVTLDHVFARTGVLTLNAQDGYTIKENSVSWKIKGKSEINGTAGTYNVGTGSWVSASSKLSSETALTSSSDMYLIPGTYTIYVTYTLVLGDYEQKFENKYADVTLVKGKTNNITATAIGGVAEKITLSVSVTAWGTENHTPTLN